MNTWKLFKSKSLGRRLLLFLMALFLVSGLVSTQAPEVARGERFNPPDDGDDQINLPPLPFNPPAGGFTWSVPPRYGLNETDDGLMDTYWRASTFDYDPAYIYPDHWSMQFYGCQTEADAENGVSTTNTYQWNIAGNITTGNQCLFNYNGFTQQGTYPVTLTVTLENGTVTSFPQEVYIKDYFIVAMGDSLASGEGNPDVRQQVVPTDPWGGWIPGNPARWQDKRCHRTAYAYPSQAAVALEYADPHTSVTFINFACSGATIFTPQYEMKAFNWIPPFFSPDPDPGKYTGTGITGPWRGNDLMPWDSYDSSTFIPPQIDQLQAALNPPAGKSARTFDALIVSAGGNDFHFGDIASACLFDDHCWPDAMIWENASHQYNLELLVQRALTPFSSGGAPTSLPDAFAELNDHIAGNVNKGIPGLNPQPAKVYITQYADQTRANSYGSYCELLDDIFWPLTYSVMPREAELLNQNALHWMNHAIQTAAEDYGWQYIDGITSYEVDPDPSRHPGDPGMFVLGPDGRGHGYCASDNWIVRADESEKIQGPAYLRLFTKGTLHPNNKGIQAIKDRLLYYLRPNLTASLPGNPPGDPPAFSSSLTSGGRTSHPGANGWYTQSCDSNQNCLPQVVLQVTATGSAPLRGANVYLNELAGCSINGVTCPTTVITPTHQVRWDFTFSADGIYQMQFSARDSNDQISDYVSEIKVDLNDPFFAAPPGPYSLDEGSGITLTVVASDTTSAILNVDWDLDNDGDFETIDEEPRLSAASLDGPSSKTVGVIVTDEAGRTAATTASVDVLNVAPTAEILNIPESASEGTEINLDSSVTDPGTADTFTYAWNVKKNGSAYASGTDAAFSFTPDDNGAYEVSLTVTDDDGDAGTASQTIDVANVAPSLSIPAPADGALYAVNTSVSLSGTFIDPGTKDTFSCSINWGDGITSSGTIGTGGCTASHPYNAAGVYVIQMTVTDDDGGSDMESVMVVVYDPRAGFVTGGGWIDSPAGAYLADPALAGKATFGFVSRYQKGATVPSGNTAFKFEAGSFEFTSSAYEWLVVNQAGTNAQFKGSGMVNGLLDPNGNAYKFMLWAGDSATSGGTDTFRMRIWWEDAAGAHDIYDNGVDQAIGGGNIVVHTVK